MNSDPPSGPPALQVVQLGRPQPFSASRDGRPGTVTFDEGVVWRTGDRTEAIPLERLVSLTASYGGHIQLPFLGALVVAMLARAAGLGVAWGIAALWVGAAMRVALDRLRPSIRVSVDGGGEPWTLELEDRSAFAAVRAMRARMPRGSNESSIDEITLESLAQIRATGPRSNAGRIIGAWKLAWMIGGPLMVWVVIWLLAFDDAYWHSKPVGETFVILAMGPPFSVLLWPLSAVPGLVIQALFAPRIAKWAESD